MQAISGSIGISMPASQTSGSIANPATTPESTGALGFLSMLITQVNSAITEDLKLTTDHATNAELEEMIGKLLPEGLPLGNPEETKAVLQQALTQIKATPEQFKGMPDQLTQLEGMLKNLHSEVDNGLGEKLESLDVVTNKLSDLKQLQSGLTRLTNAPVPTAAQTAVANQFGSTAWADEMASRVQWQISKEIQEARINLNPRELGPVEVKVSLNDDQARVQFISHHGAVREAVEDAIPRLREMLEASGITLTDANVSDHQTSPFSQEQASEEHGQEQDELLEDDVDEKETIVQRVHNALVDAYI